MNNTYKVRVKETGKELEGFVGLDGFQVMVDHTIYERYSYEELEYIDDKPAPKEFWPYMNIDDIDWKSIRIQIAKAALQGLLTKNGYSLNPVDEPIARGNFEANKPILDKKAREFAYSAVVYADALIAELKKD